MDRKEYFASVASELQQSDIYLTLKARLFEAPKPNLNGCRVTEAFLDEIVKNDERYIALPLYADVRNLTSGNYKKLGHMYDPLTGKFHSTQIGAFYKFEKEEFDGGAYLVGYARVAKRNKAVCSALSELFVRGELKFSFEVSVGSGKELDDGTFEIDADESNFLEGEAVVSFPACEDAVALDLVAECAAIEAENATLNEHGKEEEEMADNEKIIETAEEETVEVVEETAEVETEAAEDSSSESEVAEAENASEENAAVYVREEHTEIDAVNAWDSETGNEVEERIIHETVTRTCVDSKNEQTAEEEEKPEESEEPEEEDKEEEAECKKEKCGEEELASVIAQLKDELNAIREELAAMKAEQEVKVAEVNKTVEMNPFMAELTIPEEKKYTLLDPVEKTNKSYSLLDEA